MRFAVLLLLGCTAQTPAQGPDLVLFTVDTLRHDRLGFAGHGAARTPRLDDWADRSRVFAQATTPVPRTTPALASILTGLQPHRHGAREVGERIGDVALVAARLAKAGWVTRGWSGTPVAGPDQGLDHGFQRFEVRMDPRAGELVDEALADLARVPADQPVFLWVHLTDPHFPYLPEDPSLDPERPCVAAGLALAKNRKGRPALYSNRGGKAAAMLADCQALYDDEIAAVDQAFGRLLDAVEARRGPPHLVFTSDHGENMGEDGLFYEHGPSAHDASLRVPLVVGGPSVTPGRDGGVARLEDLGPTLLGLAGLDPDGLGAVDGQDLGPRLMGQAPAAAEIALAESASALHAPLTQYLVTGRADGRRCWHQPPWSHCLDKRGRPHLYNHQSDPDLQIDLLPTQPALAPVLSELQAQWPAERARTQVARTATHKLVSAPQPDGRRALALFDIVGDPGQQSDLWVEGGVESAPLEAALRAWSQEVAQAQPPPARSDAVETALRALGYVD